jgi:hypothetical protein
MMRVGAAGDVITIKNSFVQLVLTCAIQHELNGTGKGFLESGLSLKERA